MTIKGKESSVPRLDDTIVGRKPRTPISRHDVTRLQIIVRTSHHVHKHYIGYERIGNVARQLDAWCLDRMLQHLAQWHL